MLRCSVFNDLLRRPFLSVRRNFYRIPSHLCSVKNFFNFFLIRESFTAPLLRRKMYINTAPHKKQALFYLFFIFNSVLSGAPNFRNCLSNSIDRNDPDSIDFPAGLFIRARKQDACKTESFRFQNPQLSLADRPDFT